MLNPNLIIYPDVTNFLKRTRPELLANESVNNLMLGICFRLERFPERAKTPPFLASVEDEAGGLLLAAVMTPPYKVVVYGPTPISTPACRMLAQGLLDNHWSVPGVLGVAETSLAFAEAWQDITGSPVREGMKERVYELREVVPPHPAPGCLRQAVESDGDLVQDWFWAFQQEALGDDRTQAEVEETARTKLQDGDIYLWEDGLQVSLAGRNRPVVHSISVGPVYTPSSLRGRGYASNCVAALSQLLLNQGWQYCNLFTNLANPTSNAIYQQIGYQPVCDFNEYYFD